MLHYHIKHKIDIASTLSKFGDMSRINLGKKIKELRAKLKISQDQLAKKTSIPFSTLVKIEAGYTPNPSMRTLIKVADAFNISIDKLVGRKTKQRGVV